MARGPSLQFLYWSLHRELAPIFFVLIQSECLIGIPLVMDALISSKWYFVKKTWELPKASDCDQNFCFHKMLPDSPVVWGAILINHFPHFFFNRFWKTKVYAMKSLILSLFGLMQANETGFQKDANVCFCRIDKELTCLQTKNTFVSKVISLSRLWCTS